MIFIKKNEMKLFTQNMYITILKEKFKKGEHNHVKGMDGIHCTCRVYKKQTKVPRKCLFIRQKNSKCL
jgi:hypothetical protein